jgi:hypothetical protein
MSNRLKVQIEKAYYTYERYEAETSFALLYHEHPLTVDTLGSFVRISDHLIPLDEQHFENRTSCVALDTFDTHKAPDAVIKRLRLIMEQTRKSSYDRDENEHILDGYL